MRNIEKTKEKILKAAQTIMAESGFSALKVNALADLAGVGKPLIYRYFGNMDGVGKALAEKTWGAESDENELKPEVSSASDVLNDLALHGRKLSADRALRDMLAWSLASSNSPVLVDKAQDSSQIEDDINQALNPDSDKQAIYALLKAAIAFLVLYKDRNSSWVGLGLETPKEMVRLEHAMADIVNTYWD